MLLRRLLAAGASRVPPITASSSSSGPRRWQHSDDKTIVKVLNLESESGLMVDAYSQVGFKLNNGLSIVGSMALFPKTVLSWRVNTPSQINEDSLSLFYMLEPKLDLLVLGIGNKGSAVDTSIIRFMKQKGITLEILPTESACTTFNFLNMEGRYVAAALIPPPVVTPTADELVAAQRDNKTLFTDRMPYD